MVQKRILTALKYKAPICVGVAGLTKIKKINKEDTYTTSFPKAANCRPLLPNAESVDKTTNPYFKKPHVPPVAEKKV